MIDTIFKPEDRIVFHEGLGNVTTRDLVAAIERDSMQSFQGIGALWDFRRSELHVPLQVTASPTYPPIRKTMNRLWQRRKTAFLFNSNTHDLMIRLFADSGDFRFEWQTFTDWHEALAWLRNFPPTCQAQHRPHVPH